MNPTHNQILFAVFHVHTRKCNAIHDAKVIFCVTRPGDPEKHDRIIFKTTYIPYFTIIFYIFLDRSILGHLRLRAIFTVPTTKVSERDYALEIDLNIIYRVKKSLHYSTHHIHFSEMLDGP